MIRKKIHFETVSRYDKTYEPASISIPFMQGEISEALAMGGRITDGEREYPAQFRVLGTWSDGSVKWLLTRFLADLPANRAKGYVYVAELESRVFRAANHQTDIGGRNTRLYVKIVRQSEGAVVLDNGSIQMSLAAPGSDHLFEWIATPDHTYEAGEIQGPFVEDELGHSFMLTIGETGWEVVEAGDIFCMLRTAGKHYDNQQSSWLSYTLILTLWAGKSWLNLDYQLINAEDDRHPDTRQVMKINNVQAGLKYDKEYPFEMVRRVSLKLRPKTVRSQVNHKIFTSSFNYFSENGDENQTLNQTITADTIINTANEMFPEVLFSVFAGDWCDGEYALTAGIYQAYQNFPKAMDTGKDGIDLWILPETEPDLKLPQGVARTTRLYLFFRPVGMKERLLMDRALMMEMPAVPVLEPDTYEAAGVFPGLISSQFHHTTERFLYRYVDSRAKGLGMLHFGDGPEWEYIKQGRSRGKLIWINNEYDMPHNFMIMLARSGDRRYYDYLKAAAEHWYDVDLCHHSNQPYKRGLLYTHSVDHISGQPVPSHQWVEGFLDYYHLTGNPNGLEAALAIGENLLELIKLPIYQSTATVEPREIGWAMRTFIALYQETHDERYLEACRPIVEVYVRWARELGTWTTPYPDNYMDRVPFMIHVGVMGLYQYYRICPEPVVKSTLLAVVDDMVKECYMGRTDMFYGKQAPAVRFQNLNGMVLETLAVAYELTGDSSYIEKGLGMFSWISVENPPPVYDFSKYKEDEYTVIYNCPTGPKRCAQTLLPFLRYYRFAMELGYLKNR